MCCCILWLSPISILWKVDVKVITFFTVNGNYTNMKSCPLLQKVPMLSSPLGKTQTLGTSSPLLCMLSVQSYYLQCNLQYIKYQLFRGGWKHGKEMVFAYYNNSTKKGLCRHPRANVLALRDSNVSVMVSQWSTLKYFNNVWMDWNKFLRRLSWLPCEHNPFGDTLTVHPGPPRGSHLWFWASRIISSEKIWFHFS